MMVREIHHWRNLSRGLLCPCRTPKCHVTRIQSNRCERKQWALLIHDVGPELFYAISQGHIAIVHDVSTRNRETRACWQGLSWLRYACWRTWNPDLVAPEERSPRGIVLNPYWEAEFQALPRVTRHWLGYFKKYHPEGRGLYLRSCWIKGGGRLPDVEVPEPVIRGASVWDIVPESQRVALKANFVGDLNDNAAVLTYIRSCYDQV